MKERTYPQPQLIVADVLAVLAVLFFAEGLLSPAEFLIDKSEWTMLVKRPANWLFSRDMIENSIFGLPLGFVLALRLSLRAKRTSVLFASLTVGLLSISFEVLQLWIPGRTPSLWDALALFIGGVLGALVGSLGGLLIRSSLNELEKSLPSLLLVVVWLGSAFIPAQLYLSRVGYEESLGALSVVGRLGGGELLLHIVSWVIVGMLLKTVGEDSKLLFLCLFLARSLGLIFSPGRELTRESILGFFIATCLWFAFSLWKRAGLMFLTALVILYLTRRGFSIGDTNASFLINPLEGVLKDGKLAGLRFVFEELFPLLALPLLWAREGLAPLRYLLALLSLILLLIFLEIFRVFYCFSSGSSAPPFLLLFSGLFHLFVGSRDALGTGKNDK